MRILSSFNVVVALLVFSMTAFPAQAAQEKVVVLDHETGFSALSNGIAIQSGDAREEITALRDNVIRVRIASNGTMPEDSSWAVLPSARQSKINVTPESSPTAVWFQTSALKVLVSRSSMTLTIIDLSGKLVQQDALPVRFEGTSFRIYKAMPL